MSVPRGWAPKPKTNEPSLRRYTIDAFRRAALEIWGAEGLADIAARMPEGSRLEAFRDDLPTGAWIEEAHVIAWCFATWEGPANRDRPTYVRFIQRQIDLGFGRIRRFLLSIASPDTLIAKAPGIWEEDHTHGKLEIDVKESRALMTLRDHPYTETPQARATIAEVFRYTISLTRAVEVTETHALRTPNVLDVRLRWR